MGGDTRTSDVMTHKAITAARKKLESLRRMQIDAGYIGNEHDYILLDEALTLLQSPAVELVGYDYYKKAILAQIDEHLPDPENLSDLCGYEIYIGGDALRILRKMLSDKLPPAPEQEGGG